MRPKLVEKGTVSAGTSDAICQCSPDPLPQQAINAQQSGGDDAEGVCSCDRMSDDLAQLFEPLNRRGATEVRKSTRAFSVATNVMFAKTGSGQAQRKLTKKENILRRRSSLRC